MIKATLPIILVLIVAIWPSSVGALVCGKDLDGDGKITGQGETAQCVGDGGTLCPIDARNCTSATTDPICPSGGSFVAVNDRCEAPTSVTCSLTGRNFDTIQACTAACSETTACTANAVALLNSAENADYASSMTAGGASFDFNGYNYDYGPLGYTGSVYLSGFSASGGVGISYGFITSVTGAGNILWVSGYDDAGNYYTTPIYLYGATATGSWSRQNCGADRVVGSGNGLFFYEHTGDCYFFSGEAMTGAIYFQGTSCPYGSGYGCNGGTCTRTGACNPGPCPQSYTSNVGLCTAPPQCSKGTYNPADKLCHDGNYRCPYGDAFACVNNNGAMQCSPAVCFDPKAPGNEVLQSQDSSMLQDDGQKDDRGNCLGSLYIFSGRSMECRTSGQQTGWKNCCLSGESPLADDLGSVVSMGTAVNTITNVYHMGQIAYYGNMLVSGKAIDVSAFTAEVEGALMTVGETGSIVEGLMSYAQATFLNPTTLAIAAAMYLVQDLLLSGSCNQDDIETAMLDNSGMCHYLDTYCKRKWPLVGCVQEAKVFCCFNSKLARIVHEQGRPQLKTFLPPWVFGDSSGDCRGFTASEFQMLDFSKMDLSEYLGDIKTKAQNTIQNTVTDKIQQYYQKTRP
jgi:Type-1V conjugative transfer system mating pair stabilisation